jgi:hypothetical protein
MIARSRLLVLCLASLVLGISPDNRVDNVYSLSCTGRLTSLVDAPQYTLIRKMTLDGNTLTVEIEYGIRAYALRQGRTTLSDAPGMGYMLDGGPVVMIRSMSQATKALLALTFFRAFKGKHKITIGIADQSGRLMQANSFCFSAPGRFSLQGNLYL